MFLQVSLDGILGIRFARLALRYVCTAFAECLSHTGAAREAAAAAVVTRQHAQDFLNPLINFNMELDGRKAENQSAYRTKRQHQDKSLNHIHNDSYPFLTTSFLTAQSLIPQAAQSGFRFSQPSGTGVLWLATYRAMYMPSSTPAIRIAYSAFMLYTRPAKAVKAMAMIAATMKAIGLPRKDSGTSLPFRRSRMVAKMTSMSMKPSGTATELTMVSISV